MSAIPSALQSRFEEHLRIRAIPSNLHEPYQKYSAIIWTISQHPYWFLKSKAD